MKKELLSGSLLGNTLLSICDFEGSSEFAAFRWYVSVSELTLEYICYEFLWKLVGEGTIGMSEDYSVKVEGVVLPEANLARWAGF